MQEQAPGWTPPKIRRGVVIGKRGNVPKTRGMGKKTRDTKGVKSTAMGTTLQRTPVVSNNLPGFNMPGAAPFL